MTNHKRYRLPPSVNPERYELRLAPDLSLATFGGEENVSIWVKERVREINLNAAELAIQDVSISSKSGRSMRGYVALDPESEQATLHFTEMLEPGPWKLQLKFNGILNDKLHGFYRSTYKNAYGQEKRLATTQFESTDARRAFPCWDEPALKAVFQITLVVDEGLTAISNARVLREDPLPGTGKKEVVFADTIRMSTYLVVFIVGEFEGTEPVMVGNCPLRLWAVPGKRQFANFGREIGRESLEHFSRYYDIPYPGDKLDLVAIPDFASGGMENFGAITFRESALLVDESTATRAELERVAGVVSHENAHMWFGDLVTMRWWNALWLNEAFATFMEMLAVDAWRPQWRRWDSFTISRAAAMQVDGLKNTRPIEFPVEKPEEAEGMVDVLTYEKGASVLRMLEQYLGADAFRDGIRLYLRRHAYANAETTDLWDALEESTRRPARALMDSWIFQAGFPLITVEREDRQLILKQQIFRYLQDGEMPTRGWHVPIFLRCKTKTTEENRTVLLTAGAMRIELPEATESVVVNAGGHGYYRVRYSAELLNSLKRELQANLAPVERFNLVNDGWATTLAGLTSLSDYLGLLELMRDENDLAVWTSALISFHQLNRILDPAQCTSLQARVRAIISPALERFTWAPRPGENELESQLRGDLIGALGTVGEDTTCQERARALFVEYEKDASVVDRNLVPALVAIVSHTGTGSDYENFVARFKTAITPQEETRYLFALANFRREELVDRTLQLTVNGEVRTQNAPYLMRGILLNKHARVMAWNFLKANWETMLRLYPDNSIPRMCEGIIALATAGLAADVEEFFRKHPVKQGAKQMDQHLERLRIAVACKERWHEMLRT